MKHRCQGCKALQMLDHGYQCGLGYLISAEPGREIKPLEDCPKPKQYKNLAVAPSKGEQITTNHYCKLLTSTDCPKVVIKTAKYNICCKSCIAVDCPDRCKNDPNKCGVHGIKN